MSSSGPLRGEQWTRNRKPEAGGRDLLAAPWIDHLSDFIGDSDAAALIVTSLSEREALLDIEEALRRAIGGLSPNPDHEGRRLLDALARLDRIRGVQT